MPNSLRAKIKHLCHNGTLTERERDRILKVLEQTRWIPVSERLPEKVEWYLTSIKWDDGTERVTISWFDGMSFKAEVVAWQPLPQPYNEDKGDE